MKSLNKNVVNDPMFGVWYQSVMVSNKNTANGYHYGMIHYCNFTEKSPTELIEEARKDYIDRVPPWELRHVKHIEEFITHLKKVSDLANNTKLNYIKGVKHFYKFNKLPADVDIKIPQGATEKYLDLPPLKLEDVRKMVQTTGHDWFIKAFVLCMLSSGQGQMEIRTLKGKDLKNIDNGVAVVNKTRGKTNRRYFFFIGAEALQAIHDYKPDLKENEYIFTKKKSNKPLMPQEINTYLLRHVRRLGFDRAYFAPHRFRHYFKTALTGNMDTTFIEYLLGHKLGGVESNYFLGNQPKMIEAYLKNQHLLTVFTDKEVLQRQYDELKGIHDIETERIKKELETMQGQMKSLIIAMVQAEKQKA